MIKVNTHNIKILEFIKISYNLNHKNFLRILNMSQDPQKNNFKYMQNQTITQIKIHLKIRMESK
jgi:hypothetical protein